MPDLDPRSSRPDSVSVPEAQTPPAETASPDLPAKTPPPVLRPGFAGRCFELLAAVGPLTLLVFAGLLILPGLWDRGLLLPEEQRLETVRAALSREENPFIPVFDGVPYTDLPPGFFAFVDLPARLGLPVPSGSLLPTASAAALLLFILSVWGLAKAAGNTGRAALASGITVLTAFVPAVWARSVFPDFLFAACVTLSGICLHRAWLKARAPLLTACGFTAAVAAFLIQGPLGLGLPLLSSLLFLFWRGTFRRAGARDGAFGFGLMLVLLCAWVTYTGLMPNGKTYLANWVHDGILDPLRSTLPPSLDRWTLARDLALIWLPWTLLVPFLPWERLFAVPGAIWNNRTRDPGTGWLWCCLLSGLALFWMFPPERPAELSVLLPPLAVLSGRVVTALDPARSRLFFGLLGLLIWAGAAIFGLLLAAEVFPELHARLSAALPAELPFELPTAPVPGLIGAAGICFLFGLIHLFTDTRIPTGALLVWLLFCTALAQPANLIALPALSPIAASEVPSLPTAGQDIPTLPQPAETVPAVPQKIPASPQTEIVPEQPVAPTEAQPSENVPLQAQPVPETDAPSQNPPEPPMPAEPLPAEPDHDTSVPVPTEPVPNGGKSDAENEPGSTSEQPLSQTANRRPSAV